MVYDYALELQNVHMNQSKARQAKTFWAVNQNKAAF